jgi:hypothetical protein
MDKKTPKKKKAKKKPKRGRGRPAKETSRDDGRREAE